MMKKKLKKWEKLLKLIFIKKILKNL
jgi:hypothetical protein